MNVGTKTVLVGAGIWGVKKAHEYWNEREEEGVEGSTEAAQTVIAAEVPFSKSITGQALCATAAGWFQVYSGGIAIDTVATRLQNGQPLNQALWGVGLAKTNSDTLMKRFSGVSGKTLMQVRRTVQR